MPRLLEEFAHARIRTSAAEIQVRIAGDGPPLLLLHGYPQTHLMWHRVAPVLARDFTVVLTDLRGYGDSSKPASGPRSANYAKRAMALDQVEVMAALGYTRFLLCGHDRGALVASRLALDHPAQVTRLAVLDSLPAPLAARPLAAAAALRHFHCQFLAQPYPLPERMIGADPEAWLRSRLAAWCRTRRAFHPHAVADYVRCFSRPEAIRASCDDYRAATGIDLEHDGTGSQVLAMPLLVLWGAQGILAQQQDVLRAWRPYAHAVRGVALPCGHFLAEEAPQATWEQLTEFFLALPTAPPKPARPAANAPRAAG